MRTREEELLCRLNCLCLTPPPPPSPSLLIPLASCVYIRYTPTSMRSLKIPHPPVVEKSSSHSRWYRHTKYCIQYVKSNPSLKALSAIGTLISSFSVKSNDAWLSYAGSHGWTRMNQQLGSHAHFRYLHGEQVQVTSPKNSVSYLVSRIRM